MTVARRRRRLLLSRWRRVTRWEFWPPWVFYPPLLIYIAFLMVKHRGLTLFTAANPAIVAGGVVGESKFEILQALARSADVVARAELIPGSLTTTKKQTQAEAFMRENGLSFPVVLKPDNGQRGSGVVVVRSSDALIRCLSQCVVDTIIQEYVDGPEFGVFYYRFPSEARGHIFSITEKTFPAVVGDGQHSLEHLILYDDRAVSSATLYLERHQHRLRRIPRTGERVPLAEIGSHCRGSMFLDGRELLTPALEDRFDRIAAGYQGFYFGRFDVRAGGGVAAFRHGEGFRIIELNGVTSEATHIYHPGTPLLNAYRVLMDQWRIAFAIGAENRERGVRPSSIAELIALARRYRRTALHHLTAQPPDLLA